MASPNLEQRIALVTGSGSGIGAATAHELAQAGAAVVTSDISLDDARRTAERIKTERGSAHSVALDVRSSRSIEEALKSVQEHVGTVDILVNNAAVDVPKSLLATSEDEWDMVHAVTLKGVFLTTRAVLPGMIEQGRGAIVNIASTNALTAVGSDAYSAAKAGVLSLTRSVAVHHGQDGVRVNAICPATIQTPAWQERLATDPDVFERLSAWYPVGRVGVPEDVSRLVAYLASDDAGFVNGAVFVVDGGFTAGIAALSRTLPEGEITTKQAEEVPDA